MLIHDQHVHSYYSFDSEQPIREYLLKASELGLSYFVLTDHCDLNYLNSGNDLFFDIVKRNLELKQLQKEFKDIRILEGIEIGYMPSEIERINKIIKTVTKKIEQVPKSRISTSEPIQAPDKPKNKIKFLFESNRCKVAAVAKINKNLTISDG